MFHRRLVGLYALTVMEREGPLHGYGLSERIQQRTEGSWRPGPGSVYPSLRKLTEARLARAVRRGRRREYAITPGGRALLARIRHRSDLARGRRVDLSPLWAEVMGAIDTGEFLLARLRRTLNALQVEIERAHRPARALGQLRGRVVRELALASEHLAGRHRPSRKPRGPGGEDAR